MKSRWSIPALGAFFVAIALVVSGCGASGVPANAVATVAGNPISKRAFDHWLYLDFKQQSAQSPSSPVIVPSDPPQFASCVSELRAGIPQLAKKPTATLRADCASAFSQALPKLMGLFIKSYQYQAYAHKIGVNVTDAQVEKQLLKERGTQLKSEAAYTAFLKQSGYTNADLLWQVRSSLLDTKMQAKYDTKVSSADIAAYYKAHSSTFGTPETRNLRIVLAKTAATAKTALAALKHGQSWATVAKKYSTDPTTKNNGGLLTNVSKGQEDASLSAAAFAAPKGTLVGPVKGQFGYYVLQVIKITPATHQSLAKATPEIKQTLTSQKSASAQAAIDKKVQALYGSRTLCAKAYSVSGCHGYKKPKTTATTPAATPTTPATSTATTPSSSTTSSSTTSK